jgi:PAS domain S-box-containing protein
MPARLPDDSPSPSGHDGPRWPARDPFGLSLVAYGIDADLTVTFVSPSAATTLGYALPDVVGRCVFDLIHPEDVADARARLDELAHDPGCVTALRSRLRRGDGLWIRTDSVCTNLMNDENVCGLVLTTRDNVVARPDVVDEDPELVAAGPRGGANRRPLITWHNPGDLACRPCDRGRCRSDPARTRWRIRWRPGGYGRHSGLSHARLPELEIRAGATRDRGIRS